MSLESLSIPPIADARALSVIAYGNIKSPITVIRTNGNILYANQAFCKLLNYEYCGNPLAEKNIGEIMVNNPGAAEGGSEQPIESGKYFARYEGGKKRCVTLQVSKFVQDYFVVEAQPIIEEEINMSIAGIAHDLRGPVATAKMVLETLRDGNISSGEQAEMIEDGITSCDVSLLLCNNILLGSQIAKGEAKIEQKDFHPRDLVKILRAVMNTKAKRKNIGLEQSDKPNRGFKFIIPSQDILDSMHLIRGDLDKLIFISLNLLGNAFKYTDDGQVELKIELIDTDDGSDLIISVKDTGNGIDPKNLKKIFEDGVQLENGHSGIGKGLAIVKQLVEIMSLTPFKKASIEAFSEGEGKGSEFIVRIPHNISSPVASRATTPIQFAKTPDPVTFPLFKKELDTSKRVLVVNDNSLTAKLATLPFKNGLKYSSITVFTTYEEARQALETDGNEFDIVIMDMELDKDHYGTELSDLIRRREAEQKNKNRAVIIKYSARTDLSVPEGMDGTLACPTSASAITKELLRIDDEIGGLTTEVAVRIPDQIEGEKPVYGEGASAAEAGPSAKGAGSAFVMPAAEAVFLGLETLRRMERLKQLRERASSDA